MVVGGDRGRLRLLKLFTLVAFDFEQPACCEASHLTKVVVEERGKQGSGLITLLLWSGGERLGGTTKKKGLCFSSPTFPHLDGQA